MKQGCKKSENGRVAEMSIEVGIPRLSLSQQPLIQHLKQAGTSDNQERDSRQP